MWLPLLLVSHIYARLLKGGFISGCYLSLNNKKAVLNVYVKSRIENKNKLVTQDAVGMYDWTVTVDHVFDAAAGDDSSSSSSSLVGGGDDSDES